MSTQKKDLAAKPSAKAPSKPISSAVRAHMPARVVVDTKASLSSLMATSVRAADNRFSAAAQIMEKQPTAFTFATPAAPAENAQPTAVTAVTKTADASSAPATEGAAFDVSSCVAGRVYKVPLALIDPNPVGVRHFYQMPNIELIVDSLSKEKQDVAVNGFIKNGRIELIDGGTRLRAARAVGMYTLEVKIEEPPKDLREQYQRSARLNTLRTSHTALDLAVNMRKMMEQGIYATQEQMAAEMTDLKGNPLSISQVSSYMRIARLPDRLLQKMSEHEQTSALTIAIEISRVVVQPDHKERPDYYHQIAEDAIATVKEKNLSFAQTRSLMDSMLNPPKSRQKTLNTQVRFGDQTGKLKIFPILGQIQLSIAGLSPEQLEEVRTRIEKALGEPPAAQSAPEVHVSPAATDATVLPA